MSRIALTAAVLLLTACTASASDTWTARPDGLYDPQGNRVEKAIDDAFKRSDFSRKERNALIVATIGVVADIVTTKKALRGSRCKEGNWLYGKDPSTGKLVGVGALQLGGLYWLMQRDKKDYSKAGYVAGGVRLLAAGYNASLDC